MPDGGNRAARMDTDRLEALSDGVLAVIMTLMAFSLRVPAGGSFAALGPVVPHLLVYILSFAMLAIYWNNHHHLLRATERMDALVMWTNMLLLFWLSLMPFVTSWMSQHPALTVPVAVYGGVGLGAALSYTILVRSILRVNGKSSALGNAIGNDAKGYMSLVGYLLGIVVSFVFIPVAFVAYGLVAAIWFVPDRRLSRF